MSTSYSLVYGKFIELNSTEFQGCKEIKVCPDKKCSFFDKEISGKFCSECGTKGIKKEVSETKEVLPFLKDEMSKNDIDVDLVYNFYYAPTIIYSENSIKYSNGAFSIVSLDEIEKITSKKDKVYNFVVKVLKDNNIEFKEKVGVLNSVS